MIRARAHARPDRKLASSWRISLGSGAVQVIRRVRFVGMVEAQDLGMQRLTREIDPRGFGRVAVIFRVIRPVADQRQPGVRGLRADLMFAARLEAEPKLGDDLSRHRPMEIP